LSIRSDAGLGGAAAVTEEGQGPPVVGQRGRIRRRSPRGPRRLRQLVALGVLLVIALAAAGGSVLVPREAKQLQEDLSRDFVSAQAHLTSGKTKLAKATADRDAAGLEPARAEFKAALADFNRGHQRLQGVYPLLVVGSNLPGAGRYVSTRERTAYGLVNMGIALSEAALAGVDAETLFLKPDPQGQGAARMVTLLKQVQPSLAAAKADLQRAQQSAADVDLSLVPAAQRTALSDAAKTITKGITDIEQVAGLIPVLLEILGGNGKRSYLIEQVNPAELRAGGGFIGSYSVLSADQGALKLVKSGSIDAVDYPRAIAGQPGYTEAPPPIIDFTSTQSWVLGDSNFYPDFPTNAKWGEFFAQKEIKIKVDGVISIDPYVIGALLDVTGPIKMTDYNITIQSKGFVDDLFWLEAGPGRQPNRKAFLGAVATEILTRVGTLKSDKWPSLLQILNNAVSQRHLQVYFNDSAAEKKMTDYGWSGALNPTSQADFMYEVESNFGATKANYFVDRKYSIDLSLQGNTLHHRIVVSLADSAPQGITGRHYRCYMRLYVPDSATGLKMLNAGPDKRQLTDIPAGMKLLDGWFQIDVPIATGVGRFQVVFQYDTPWVPDPAGQGKIYWQKQPGTVNDAAHLTWTTGGHKFEVSGDLAQDRLITLGPSGITLTPGVAGNAQLPNLSF
jgi:hypothetical protein